MKKEIFQIVYVSDRDNPNEIHSYFKEEAYAMQEAGILIGIKPLPEATQLMYRGTTISKSEYYPQDSRYINTASNCLDCLHISRYCPLIEDLSIETFFEDNLNANTAHKIQDKGWEKAFIKKDRKALEHIDEGKSVWPQTSFEEMFQTTPGRCPQGWHQVSRHGEKGALVSVLFR